MVELSVFKTFYDLEEANEFATILADHGIQVEVNDLKLAVGSYIVGDISQGEIYVKIPPHDFKRANEVINNHLRSVIQVIPEDYYLNSLSNEELVDIIDKAEEWSNNDLVMAQKILEERGYPINEAIVKEKARRRLTELAKAENEKTSTIVIGYLCAFVFSIYGVFYGIMLFNAKKLLPDGRQVPAYTDRVRNHGYIISVISICFIVLTLVRVFTNAFGHQLVTIG